MTTSACATPAASHPMTFGADAAPWSTPMTDLGPPLALVGAPLALVGALGTARP